jgi:nitrogen-specific signal transduction histidine kinase
MSSALAILLFIFATNAVISIAVFVTNPKRSQNQLFLLFSSSLALWVLCVIGIINSRANFMAEIGIRGASIAGASIPVTFYLFCQSISSPELIFRQLCGKSKLILYLSIVVAIMCGTNFFLSDVVMPTEENGLRVPEAAYGQGFIVFMLFFPLVIYRTIYIFYKTLKTSTGTARVEMQFALLGMTSALPIAVIIHLVAIVSGSSQPQQFGPLCIIPMNLVIAYGIATKRILGIETILRRATAYILLVTFLALVYIVSWVAANFFLRDIVTDPSLLAQVAATLIALLSLGPTQHRMHTAANKLLFSRSMDATAALKKASEIFQSVSTIDSLLNQFLELVQDTLQPKEVYLLGMESEVFKQQHSKHKNDILTLSTDSPIAEMLRRTKTTVCSDTLLRIRATAQTRAVETEMEKANLSLAVGLFSKGNLSGMLLMGSKKGSGFYDKNEQDALQILCNQFAVALENAQLYTEVQDSKIRNEIMLDQLVSGVIVANPERKISLFNHEAQRITGIEDSAAVGKGISDLPSAICLALETTLKNKTGKRNVEARLYEQDETRKSLHIRMGTTYLPGHDQKPMGALLVFTDMTELKSLEEQVRRSDQLSSVGTLAAGMAHEIKNPLVTIKTFTQLLPERYEDADFRKDFSSLVADEVARIDGIVNELLSFSKPTRPHLIPMNLHNVIGQILKLTNEQMAQKNIVVNDVRNASKNRILGDAKLLSQAIINLTLNAVEAIGKDGTITVGTMNSTYRFANGDGPDQSAIKECIRIQISDSGQGIAPDHIKKIFDPFFTRKSEGTGMGLSVAHGIIQDHHAVIDVESETGKGSTFYIYIPVIEEEVA